METIHIIRDLTARTQLFQALAVCFGNPATLAQEIESGALRESFGERILAHRRLERLRPLLDRLLVEADRIVLCTSDNAGEGPTIAEEYTYLFRRRTPVPLNESSYGIDLTFARTREMADVASYYRAFGFEVDSAGGEMPDHIGVQLEFLAVLCFKEAYARQRGWLEEAEISLEARRSYLTDHLTGWMPVFRATLERSARIGFYSAAGALVQEAVTIEHESVGGGEPTMVLRPRKKSPDEDVPMTCAACPALEDSVSEGDLPVDIEAIKRQG